jgi:ubiquitin carboxyl-terminal hydrolase 5/13
MSSFKSVRTSEELEMEDEEEKQEEQNIIVDESNVEQLMVMGFSKNRATRALLSTKNNGVEVAMEWLFSHMDDPTLDDPIPVGGSDIVSNENIEVLIIKY